MRRIILKSNFHDYYDYSLDSEIPGEENVIFERISTGGLSRSEMFPFMQTLGIEVPRYGLGEDFKKFEKAFWCVVYTDERAHQGEGKLRILSNKIPDEYNSCFSAKYIYKHEMSKNYWYCSRSYRWLRIGFCNFFLQYFSSDDWRSNVGNVKISIVDNPGIDVDKINKPNLPLFAIDFVSDRWNRLFGIDFNIAPGISGTPIEKMIPPTDLVNFIRRWYAVWKK